MKICLVTAFLPSGRALNEYSYHIAREIQRHPGVELVILADDITDYEFPKGPDGSYLQPDPHKELPGFNVRRCWKFGSASNPMRLLKAIRDEKPDVVWFNLVFSSFGAPENHIAAFAGLSAPALSRAAGFYTHVTLHHIVEHVNFSNNGVGGGKEKIYRIGTNIITRMLLKAHSVSVLLSAYRRTLVAKYAAENVVLGTHGIFTPLPSPPDFKKRGNPELRILAFGHWGTYKRLEVLMEAFPRVLEKIPNARLVVAGGNHSTRPGYWESVRDAQPSHLPIEFRGYIPSEDVPELFATTSVLVMPYDSSTGSSGPAHQACEYGVPIVCADILDFRCMAADEDMAVNFFKVGDADDLAENLIAILHSQTTMRDMAEHNYHAGVQMTMATIARNYLRWFELHQHKRAIARRRTWFSLPGRWFHALTSDAVKPEIGNWTVEADLLPGDEDRLVDDTRNELQSSGARKSSRA